MLLCDKVNSVERNWASACEGTFGMRGLVPWWAKLMIKLVLARVPVRYRVWKTLGVFVHGRMDLSEYALEVCQRHYELCNSYGHRESFVLLELGPGDSLFSAIVGKSLGASQTYLVDVARFATETPEPYWHLHDALNPEGCRWLNTQPSISSILANCNAAYLTEGIASLKHIPDCSVDYVWSQAVLEHVRLDEFQVLLAELRRILRPHGVCSHEVDYRDHFNMAINHLRFPRTVWESNFFSKSGFYTNRIRISQMIKMCQEAGFSVETKDAVRWPTLPLSRSALATEFQNLGDSELRTAVARLVWRPFAGESEAWKITVPR